MVEVADTFRTGRRLPKPTLLGTQSLPKSAAPQRKASIIEGSDLGGQLLAWSTRNRCLNSPTQNQEKNGDLRLTKV